MAQLTNNLAGRIVDFQIDPQGTTTMIMVRLRIRSAWLNRIATMLISVLLLVTFSYQHILTPDLLETLKQWVSAQ